MNIAQLTQKRVGLLALKVDLKPALGARLRRSVWGNLDSPFLVNEIVLALLRVAYSVSTPGTASLLITLVLMICTVSPRPECLPASSM